MKQQLNVIDLDKTLLPYDSFRLMVKEKIFSVNLVVIRLTFARVIRLISACSYKEKMVKHLQLKYDETYFMNFAEERIKDIDTKVLELIKNHTTKKTTNILLSASPDLFVKHIIQKLHWVGKGSYIDEDENFVHLYGKKKIDWLLSQYKPTDFIYNFAISDSESDKDLLVLFKKSIKWTLQ